MRILALLVVLFGWRVASAERAKAIAVDLRLDPVTAGKVISTLRSYDAELVQLRSQRAELRRRMIDPDDAQKLLDTEGRISLFCGDQYVRYARYPQEFVDEGYPRSIATHWPQELGFGPLPVHVVEEDVRAGRLWRLPPHQHAPVVDVHLVHDRSARLSRAERMLLADLRRAIASIPIEERTYP